MTTDSSSSFFAIGGRAVLATMKIIRVGAEEEGQRHYRPQLSASPHPKRRNMKEQIREEIARVIREDFFDRMTIVDSLEIASKILAIDGILIKDDDQGLPLSGPYSLGEATSVRAARQDMLKAGFVKCLPKE